jgi:iron complex transport system permease protein
MKNLALVFSFFIIIIAPFFGQVDISYKHIFDNNTMDYQVFWDIRFPRVILAFLVGGVLSLSGLIFQSVFRNPMSTPFTLGVASGATLFTAIGIVLGFASYISLFAFIGSLLTIVLLFVLASRFRQSDTSSLLLVGIALSFFYSACLMVLFFISDLSESYEIVRFTMGSLDIVGFDNIYFTLFSALMILLVVSFFKNDLKLILVSYEFAQLKGCDVKKTNYTLLFTVSIAVGICVSITGPIGFIGLIVPHILKTIYKQSSDKLVTVIFFYGGVFLVFCDMIARNIGTNSDVPIGVVTSFLGAPFFIYLIIRRKK